MYNKVILIGRLTATPEMVKTASDRSFTRVTVAVNRRYKTQNALFLFPTSGESCSACC